MSLYPNDDEAIAKWGAELLAFQEALKTKSALKEIAKDQLLTPDEKTVLSRVNAVLANEPEMQKAAENLMHFAREHKIDNEESALTAISSLLAHYNEYDSRYDAELRAIAREIGKNSPNATARCFYQDIYTHDDGWKQVRGEVMLDVYGEMLAAAKMGDTKAIETALEGIYGAVGRTEITHNSDAKDVTDIVWDEWASRDPKGAASLLANVLLKERSILPLVKTLVDSAHPEFAVDVIQNIADGISDKRRDAADIQFACGEAIVNIAAANKSQNPALADRCFDIAKNYYCSVEDAKQHYAEKLQNPANVASGIFTDGRVAPFGKSVTK